MMQHKRFYLLFALSMVALFTAVFGLSALSRPALADVAAPAEPSALLSPLPEPVWSHTGIQQFGHEGTSITAADLNGDGYADIVVGEPNYNAGPMVAAGRVLIFYYDVNFNGFPNAPDLILFGSQAGARFGFSTAVGDFNGDEMYDLAVGAPGRAAVVVYNGNNLSNADIIWSYTASDPNSEFGHTLLALYPQSLDDFSYELAVGAPNAVDPSMTGSPTTGAVYIFYANDFSGLENAPTLTRYGNVDSRFGHALAVGDIDGNGVTNDLAIGAPELASDFMREGGVHIYALQSDPLAVSSFPDNVYIGGQEDGYFGYAVEIADLNADSYGDLLVGMPGYEDMVENPIGAAMVFWGQPVLVADGAPRTMLAPSANWMATGSFPGSWFGGSLTAVDYNKDGWLDLAIGAKNQPYNLMTPGAGALFFYFYEGMNLPDNYNWKIIGRNENAFFGATLAAADYNFDNSGIPDDLLIGAPHENTETQTQAGAVYHYPGAYPASPPYGLTAAGPSGIPVGQMATFSATVGFGENFMYEWDFGDGLPRLTTFAPDASTPAVVNRAYLSQGIYEQSVRLLYPQPYPLEEITRTVAVGLPVNLALQVDKFTRFENATRFRVGVQSPGPVDLLLDFGNGITETLEIQPGSNVLRLAHQYNAPGFYKVTAVALNEVGFEWSATARVRVVRTVSALDGGQIRHEWGNDPNRVFLVDVDEGAVSENYELHFNPVGDATFSNPFPENNEGNIPVNDVLDDDDLTPLNISVFFDLEVHDPLGDHCTFLPLVQGNGTGSGGFGSTATSPCLTGGATSIDSFNEPLLLTFTYKDEDIPDGTNEEDIRFVYFDTELNQWIDGATTCPGGSDASYIRDPANNTIQLPICHQSRWGISTN